MLAANGKNGFNTMPFIKWRAEDKKKKGELEAKLKEAEQAAARAHKRICPSLRKVAGCRRKAHASNKDKPVWVSLSGGEREEQGGATFKKQADGSWLASGKNLSGTPMKSAPRARAAGWPACCSSFPDKSLPNQSFKPGIEWEFRADWGAGRRASSQGQAGGFESQ